LSGYTKLDYGCGDPFYNIKKEQKDQYEEKQGLEKQMSNVI
jgi:hypothetical protein